MNEEIKNKLQRGLALTVKESWELSKYIEVLEQEPCTDAISRADAIKAVTTMCEEYTPTKSTYHPHIDFVVEELNKLPSVRPKPTECEDAISRQAVLDLCDMQYRYKIPYEYDDGDKHIKGYNEGRIINVTKLKKLQTVISQPKIGHWKYSKEILAGVYCSECKEDYTIYHSEIFNYCPNCGAKMERE